MSKKRKTGVITPEDIEDELPTLALKALHRMLTEKASAPTRLHAAQFILSKTRWRDAPRQELHFHITQEQITEAKRNAGLLPPKK